MKEFWNERYSASEYAYGIAPNEFFAGVFAGLKPGKILFPAEGEGRNSVFAAESGWDVSAFDLSESGKKKADQLAVSRRVSLEYQVGNLSEITYPAESFDVLVLVFAHFPASLRENFHRKLSTFLKPGGTLILEGFSKDHLKFSSVNPLAGGPKDLSMLFSEEELRSDFKEMQILSLEEKEVELKEGLYHSGKSAVIRLVARKEP
jgi:2-polyprenyl-3-methyl-5-hydroxy-6-metoxy-1,4-benzoquinol methylase